MNRFVALTVLLAWCWWSNIPLQTQTGSEKDSSLEKRAMAVTQKMSASDLDGELPKMPFVDWFEKTVGSNAGVIWKLSECGDRAEGSTNPMEDLRACAEVNATLADGRKVIAMITVGTFKKGITGAPAYSFGVIEHDEELYQVQRLRDLPKYIKDPGSILKGGAVKLLALETPKLRPALSDAIAVKLPEGSETGPIQSAVIEAPPPPEAKPRQVIAAPRAGNAKPEPAPSKPATQLGAVAWGDAVTKVQPKYPMNAKRVNASGTVDVQITISETGRVRAAKAINGHPLLRTAAEDAARLWVFKPAALNGASVETQIILTFAFNPPQ
jgi:TonB family protein